MVDPSGRAWMAAVAAVAIATAGIAALPGSVANAQPRAAVAAAHCDGSVPSTKHSVYDTTPTGAGPWQVPRDRCNPEGFDHYMNCAYWAAEKRPDIWKNAVSKPGGGYTHGLGGAWNVELDAKKYGYRINHTPRVGDIAAWPPNAAMGTQTSHGTTLTRYASDGGHVAYVEKVVNDHITVSSMGLHSAGGYTFTLKYNRHKTYFIHRGRTS